MRRQFRVTLDGDASERMETTSFTLPFDAREVWGKARVPVKVTINGYAWRSTVANMRGCQFIVVNADARKGAGVRAGDTVSVTVEPDAEKRDIDVPEDLRNALRLKLAAKLDGLAFTHKKGFVEWYAGAKKEETRALASMKKMLASGKTIS